MDRAGVVMLKMQGCMAGNGGGRTLRLAHDPSHVR
jgi:hypothetical protein